MVQIRQAYVSLLGNIRVVRDLIDIVVVLPMYKSWTPILSRAGSILTCASMRLGCQVPAD